MSDIRRVIEKYVNVETGALVTSDNGALRDGNSLVLFVGTQTVVRLHLRMADGVTPFVPDAGGSWFFGIDDSYVSGHAEYVVTDNTKFNLIADWSGMDLSQGKICFQVNTATTELVAAMGAVASKNMVGEVWYTPPGVDSTILLQCTINVKNIVSDVSSTGELTYVTTTLLRRSGQNDLVLMFPDGTAAEEWKRS